MARPGIEAVGTLEAFLGGMAHEALEELYERAMGGRVSFFANACPKPAVQLDVGRIDRAVRLLGRGYVAKMEPPVEAQRLSDGRVHFMHLSGAAHAWRPKCCIGGIPGFRHTAQVF